MILSHLVTRTLINPGSACNDESTFSLIHLNKAVAVGSAAICLPNSDWILRRGKMKLRSLSSSISSMRSFLWSSSANITNNNVVNKKKKKTERWEQRKICAVYICPKLKSTGKTISHLWCGYCFVALLTRRNKLILAIMRWIYINFVRQKTERGKLQFPCFASSTKPYGQVKKNKTSNLATFSVNPVCFC